MKSIISKTALGLALIATAASCTEDMEYKDVNVTPVTSLYEPADQKAVELQASATASVFFEWAAAKTEDSGAPLYEVLFDSADGDFSNPLYKVLSDDSGMRNYLTLSHKDLNRIGALAGLAGGETGTIKWSVVASRGINTTSPSVSRLLTITRLLGFADTPTQVFVTGEGSEGGNDLSKAIACVSPESDVFEVFTYLKAGKTYRLVGDRTENAASFHIDGTKILEGDGESTVEEDGVYRINMDFSIASAKLQKIDKVEFFFSPENQTLFELPYAGNGVFTGNGTVNFKQESWGLDQRYKFLMTYGDGSQKMWGADSSLDSAPGAASYDDPYFYAYEWDLSQWDQKWKLNDEFNGRPITVSLIFNVANYYHTVGFYGDAPTEPETPTEPELTTPAELQLSGDAAEGNISFKKTGDNTFEAFTRIEGGKSFKLSDGNGTYYHIEGTEIKSGDGESTIPGDGVYCLTFDFATATFTAEEITRFSVFDCWHDGGSAVLDLNYIGNGEWEATGVAHDSSRNTDDRYKFIMEIGGHTQQWGTLNSVDEGPDGTEEYYYMTRVKSSQWDDKWKYADGFMDKNLHIVVKLHDTYTHSIELAE